MTACRSIPSRLLVAPLVAGGTAPLGLGVARRARTVRHEHPGQPRAD
jgi:hypothetical protein